MRARSWLGSLLVTSGGAWVSDADLTAKVGAGGRDGEVDTDDTGGGGPGGGSGGTNDTGEDPSDDTGAPCDEGTRYRDKDIDGYGGDADRTATGATRRSAGPRARSRSTAETRRGCTTAAGATGWACSSRRSTWTATARPRSSSAPATRCSCSPAPRPRPAGSRARALRPRTAPRKRPTAGGTPEPTVGARDCERNAGRLLLAEDPFGAAVLTGGTVTTTDDRAPCTCSRSTCSRSTCSRTRPRSSRPPTRPPSSTRSTTPRSASARASRAGASPATAWTTAWSAGPGAPGTAGAAARTTSSTPRTSSWPTRRTRPRRGPRSSRGAGPAGAATRSRPQ